MPKSELIAISRLLWDIGSQDTTNHQHRVDCYHWGALLDNEVGLPPWPTPGEPTQTVIGFYEGVKNHLAEVIDRLKTEGTEESA